MSKFRLHKKNILVVLLLLCSVGLFFPHPAQAVSLPDVFGDVFSFFITPVAVLVLTIANLILYVTGVLLNNVVNLTVVQMAQNLSSGGIGDTISATWGTVRDIANMLFIFILLYTAIMTIFGQGNYKETIKNLIIAALLINFSLFFTKVIIDAANLLALLFYKAIAPGALNGSVLSDGISNTFTRYLGLTHLIDPDVAGKGIKDMGINALLSTAVLMIASFIFVAVAVMFIVRYVILILVLILSPLMFASYILPRGAEGSDYTKKWWSALIGQAFFAPAYFFMTWVALKVIAGLQAARHYTPNWDFVGVKTKLANGAYANAAPSAGLFDTVLNYGLMIAFLIASIVVAKAVSSRSGKEINNLTKWATGAGSNLVFGGAIGGLGRTFIGSKGAKMAEDPELIKKANSGSIRSRLQLYAAKKAASGTYDPRKMKVPLDYGVGDTKLGRTLNIDKLPKIGIGEQAAKQVGDMGKPSEKGYKENKEADEKRERDIDKARAQEVRKADNKLLIQSGQEAAKIPADTRTPAQQKAVDDLAKAIKNMSEAEVVNQRATILATQEVAEALSQKQMDKIEGSDNFTAAEIQSIKDARGKRINDAFAAGGATLPIPPGSPAGTTALTGHQTAINIMRKMSYSDVAKMDVAKLTEPGIFDIYTTKYLNKLGRTNELTDIKATAIKNAILAEAAKPGASKTVTDAAAWLTGIGRDLY